MRPHREPTHSAGQPLIAYSRKVLFRLVILGFVALMAAGCSDLDEAEDTCDYEDCPGDGASILGSWAQKECVELEDGPLKEMGLGDFAKTQLVFSSDGDLQERTLLFDNEDCSGIANVDPPGHSYAFSTGDYFVDNSGLLSTKITLVYNVACEGNDSVAGHFYASSRAGLCFSDQIKFQPICPEFQPSTLDGELDLFNCFERYTGE